MERIAAVRTQASQRRAVQESRCAAAVRAMRDRGEDLAEIARLARIDQKAVRELLKIADQKPESASSDGKKPEPDPGSDAGSKL